MLTAADVQDALTLVRVADLLDPMADTIAEPLSALRRHDTDHGTAFIDTVAAVLDHPGNLSGAARELGIHANSLRYRLDRIRVVSGIDLHSAAARLRASLGLLVWERRGEVRARSPARRHRQETWIRLVHFGDTASRVSGDSSESDEDPREIPQPAWLSPPTAEFMGFIL